MQDADRPCFIYHLLDSDGNLRYIGSAFNPYRRMLSHDLEMRRVLEFPACRGCPVTQWMVAEHKAGRRVTLLIVARYERERECREAEWAATRAAVAGGADLMNSVVKGFRVLEHYSMSRHGVKSV